MAPQHLTFYYDKKYRYPLRLPNNTLHVLLGRGYICFYYEKNIQRPVPVAEGEIKKLPNCVCVF